jgi:hypothetical protein
LAVASRDERLNETESLPTMRTERRCVDPPIHNVGGASLKLREHHRRAGEQRTRRRDVVLEAECDREVKDGDAFHRATTSDLVVTSFDATGRGAESLGGIQNGRRRSTEQLIPKIRAQRRSDRRAGAASVERNAVNSDFALERLRKCGGAQKGFERGNDGPRRFRRANDGGLKGGHDGCSGGGVGIHDEVLSFPTATIGARTSTLTPTPP